SCQRTITTRAGLDIAQSQGLLGHYQPESGLVMLTVSFVGLDPKRTSGRPVMLMHGHPSDDPTPSAADIEMTKQVATIAKPLGVQLSDHIIVGKDGHASLKGLRLI